MRQLKRLNEPQSFFKGEKKIAFYKDLRDTKGKVRDRWNLPIYQNDIKKVLAETTGEECVFCGKKVGKNDFDVEHYFPKEMFPYLSYSFENYLCCCKHCNQSLKRTYYPKSLEDRREKLGEAILVGEIDGIIAFDKKEILEKTTDRIIEPTFDKIDEHLEFEPISGCYVEKSKIGTETNKMFFIHREFVKILQDISEVVMEQVKNGAKKEDILSWSKICGYSFYIEKFYDYWAEYFPA